MSYGSRLGAPEVFNADKVRTGDEKARKVQSLIKQISARLTEVEDAVDGMVHRASPSEISATVSGAKACSPMGWVDDLETLVGLSETILDKVISLSSKF